MPQYRLFNYSRKVEKALQEVNLLSAEKLNFLDADSAKDFFAMSGLQALVYNIIDEYSDKIKNIFFEFSFLPSTIDSFKISRFCLHMD